MRKRDYEELGQLITREMMAMLRDERLSADARIKVLLAVVDDTDIDDTMLSVFASSLKTGFDIVNKQRRKSIDDRRETQRNYAKRKRLKAAENDSTSTDIDIDRHLSTPIDIDRHISPTITKQNNTKQDNIPPKSPLGDCGENDNLDFISLADRIEASEAFAHARVNRGALRKCTRSILKNSAATDVLEGLAKWTEAWRADDWRFVPGKLTDWLYDGKYLEEPRKKEAPTSRSDPTLDNGEII